MLEANLILPESAPTLNRLLLGKTETDGLKVYSVGFNYRCVCGNEFMVSAVATEKDSSNQVEDILNSQFEKLMTEEEERHQRAAETLDPNAGDLALKLDVAEELRHIRNWLRKRKWAANGLYKGVSIDANTA